MLQITDIQARNLSDAENVYIVFELESERVETPVYKDQAHHPKWQETLQVKATVHPGHSDVKVLAYSKHTLKSDTLIGSASVQLASGQNHVQLKDASGAATGTVDFCASGAGLKRGNSGAETYEGGEVPASTGFAGGGAAVHSDAGVKTGRAFDPTVLHDTKGDQPTTVYESEDLPSTAGVTGGGASAYNDHGLKTGRAYQGA